MFQCLKRAVYQVSDIEKAKNWYRMVLDQEPALDAPFAVAFRIGDSGLTLAPNANAEKKCNESVVVY